MLLTAFVFLQVQSSFQHLHWRSQVFCRIDVIISLKPFDVLFDNNLSTITLYSFILLLGSLVKSKDYLTNTSSSSLQSFHIIRKEKYRKPRQVSLRQSTLKWGNWKWVNLLHFLPQHLNFVVRQIGNSNR